MKYRVRIKPGLHHAEFVGGQEIEVTEQELSAFGDKFILLGEVVSEPEPPRTEGEVVKEIDEDDLLETDMENIHIEDSAEPESKFDWSNLDISSSALKFVKENGLEVEAFMLSGKGSGLDGRILVKDVKGLV